MRLIIVFFYLLVQQQVSAQKCRFEQTNGKETATYFEAIDWYKKLDQLSSKVMVKEMGATDAGYPLHLVLVSNDEKFNPSIWHKQNKAIILINNGIHPGEPDGIDASMMLVRDIVRHQLTLPDNVVLAFIPVYNIGGCLNRGTSSRANQDGPLEYGFRGNAQNLDLNRDFTKCDSKEARSFAQLFQWLSPAVFIDNHVSDGADYQHTFTLIATQYDKLGNGLGRWLKEKFEPALYNGMQKKGWDICPYVNFETASPDKGMEMFYDPPRYSSGYAALFQTVAFVPETHMLKPFKERVLATYAFMQTLIEKTGEDAAALIKEESIARAEILQQQQFPLSWKVDSAHFSTVHFKGYATDSVKSEVTGMNRLFYDHNKPFEKDVKFYNVFKPAMVINKPKAYIIPQGWNSVVELMKLNGVKFSALLKDTIITVETYHIDEYKSYNRAYEKHHKNYAVKISSKITAIKFLKGDYIVYLDQPVNRYIVEMLEPQGDDSFFAWNFFDGILQQKEGYSDYRWEDVAAKLLANDIVLQKMLHDKKEADASFAADAAAQLEFVYKHSAYYEPVHLRYPVFRLLQ